MVCFDDVAMFEVNDGAGKFEDAMKGTASEMKLLHGGAKQALRSLGSATEVLNECLRLQRERESTELYSQTQHQD